MDAPKTDIAPELVEENDKGGWQGSRNSARHSR